MELHRRVVTITAGLAGFASLAGAELAPQDWTWIVDHADAIVVATDLRIEERSRDGWTDKLAVSRVETRLAGQPTPTVRYHARPGWFCDISTANPGETVLLFLRGPGSAPEPVTADGAQSEPVYAIAWHGYGRLAVSDSGSVTLCGEVPRHLRHQARIRKRDGCLELRLDRLLDNMRARRALLASPAAGSAAIGSDPSGR